MISSLATTAVVCDTMAPLTDFDVVKYAGTWYEQQHHKGNQEPGYYQCTTAQYTSLRDDTETSDLKDFNVYNSFQTKILGHWTPRVGVHPKGKCGTDGACYISYFGSKVPEPNHYVVETDYETYAINYFCDVENNRVHLWMNTREASITDEFFNKVYAKAMKLAPSFDVSTLDKRII